MVLKNLGRVGPAFRAPRHRRSSRRGWAKIPSGYHALPISRRMIPAAVTARQRAADAFARMMSPSPFALALAFSPMLDTAKRVAHSSSSFVHGKPNPTPAPYKKSSR